MKTRRKAPKARNPVAKALGSALFRKRVVQSRKAYRRAPGKAAARDAAD